MSSNSAPVGSLCGRYIESFLFWLKLHQYIHVTVLALLTTRKGAKQTNPLHAEGFDTVLVRSNDR
jgi:hypothetical protein